MDARSGFSGLDPAAGLDTALLAIARGARLSVPGFDHVGICTVDRDGVLTTRAATDDLVRELDALQYRLDEGPSVDALRRVPLVVAPDIRNDRRWARYVPQAARSTDLKAQMAVRLVTGPEGTLGGLNLYSTRQTTVPAGAAESARAFAAHAAAVLDQARQISDLLDALRSRKVIGQALGLVMERHQVNEERAFTFLAQLSSYRNVTLREVAQSLVDEADRR